MFESFRNNKRAILQFFRIALWSGVVFIALLLVVVSILAWVYRDSIKEHFVSQINKGLQTEVYINDISVNFFRSFPLASISLKNVTMLESGENAPKDTLLHASRVYFQFSIIDVFKKNYTIRQAEVANGFIKMKVWEDGSVNYAFWNDGEMDAQTDQPLDFHLQRVQFNDIDYRYVHYKNGHDLDFSIDRMSVSGNFSRNNYTLGLRGGMMLNKVEVDRVWMIGNRTMNFDFEADVTNNNVFVFRKGNFKVGSHAFAADGTIFLDDSPAYIDLAIAARDLKLENFIQDLPPNLAKHFKGYRSRGDFYFDATVKGHFSSFINPEIIAAFGVRNGELSQRSTGLKLQDLSFQARFNNGSQRNIKTSSLRIDDFNAHINGGEISGNMHMVNLEEPDLDLKLFSNINAEKWHRFLKPDTIVSAKGELLVDIEFKGKLGKKMKINHNQFMASRVNGSVKASDLSFRIKDDPRDYHSIHADFTFNNNDILVHRFSGNASSSDFSMNGYFRNVLPWLFIEGERIFVDATLSSGNLNFNELLQHSVSESDTTYRLTLSDKIDFNLKADVGNVSFKRFEAKNVKGTLSMRDQVFYAGNISLAAMKGTINASGYINGKNEDHLIMGCEATFVNVDVYDLFYQMGDFGQKAIGHENLRGRITADARFVSRWSPYLEIDWDALETTADIKVENGELINYKPMLHLSRFIRVGDLNQVKFSTLENQIRIKNQTIFIPDMEINSSAINIKLSGEHSFQNEINYRLQVLLSDLLARRNRESRNPQEQYGDIIDDGLGRTTLFLLVTGTIDEPVFRYDTRGVREKLREDLRQERQNLIDVFRAEFGTNRPDTLPDGTLTPEGERQKEQKDIEKRERGKFIIEWDD